jgi:putative endonuclease
LDNVSKGRLGEKAAKKRLLQLGYNIIETNYRVKEGEIDIVSMDGDVLVFVEVKARSGKNFGSAEEAVDSKKMVKLSEVALSYITEKSLHEMTIRFDVVAVDMSVSPPKINIIKNAFESTV